MKKHCSVHNKLVIVICLYPGCEQPFLCIQCCRAHLKEHESDLSEVEVLADDTNWIEDKEKQRDNLVIKANSLFTLKNNLIAQNKTLLETMFKDIMKSFEAKIECLIKDLSEGIPGGDELALQNLLPKLDTGLQDLENFNFRSEDLFEKVNQVKMFNESIFPNAQDLVDNAQSILYKWTLDEEKLDTLKEEIIDLLKSVNLDNLYRSSVTKSLKEPQELVLLKHEHEKLKRETNKQIQELSDKIKTNRLNHTQQIMYYRKEMVNFETFKRLLCDRNSEKCGEMIKIDLNRSIYYCRGFQNQCQGYGYAYGENPYSGDSNKCKMARHAGVVGIGGGFYLLKKQEAVLLKLSGSTQNGVTTYSCSDLAQSAFYLS